MFLLLNFSKKYLAFCTKNIVQNKLKFTNICSKFQKLYTIVKKNDIIIFIQKTVLEISAFYDTRRI